MQSPTLWIAFLAGLLSFLSPCVLPLVPAYIGYLGGSALPVARGVSGTGGGQATMTQTTARGIVLANALLFVLGFTIVFAMIGNLAGALSTLLYENKRIIQYVAGGMLFIFGLHMIGLIRIQFLDYTRRLDVRPAQNLGYVRSFLIGLGFGVGWTPCIGPTLGLIFTLALNGNTQDAFVPFVAYSLGLGVPFLITALAMGQISGVLKRLTRRSYTLKAGKWKIIDQVNIVSLVSGVLLVVMGFLVFFNLVTLLAPPDITWFVL
ncbi:MAG: cytochrome c biogenesis CcdA family protein [Chloroflexota bacterium]|nr:cytochrome c biogenesis CcdA family protein [Chloroflexota bacterium]MDQ5864929.1 cytochrome c biogenesis CcdA family protein [Chloroflexota bacterium]